MASQSVYNGGLAVEVLLLGRWLDAAALGLYFYALALASLVEVGVHWGAQHYLNKEAAARFGLLRQRLPGMLVVSVSTVVIAGVAVGWRLGWALGLVAAAALARATGAMLGAVYIGRGRLWVPAASRVLAPVVALPALWLAVRPAPALEPVSLVIVAATVAYLAPIVFGLRRMGLLAPTPNRSAAEVWRWLPRLWPFVALFFLGQLFYRVDGALIQWLASEREVARYMLAFKWVEGFFFLPAVVASAVIPRLVGRSPGDARRVLGTAVAALVTVLVLAAVFLRILGEPLLGRLLADAFAGSVPTYRLLVWALPVQGLGVLLGAALIALDRERALLGATGCAVAVGVAAKTVSMAHWGLAGFAWASILTLAANAAALTWLAMAATRGTQGPGEPP